MICTIFCSTHVRPGDPLAECSNIKFEITSNESHITEARQYCRAQSHSRPVTGDRLVYDKGDKLSIDKRSLNSNHHLVEFFSHVFWAGPENCQPHGQRANVALILWLPLSRLASSQTPTDPKAFLLSQSPPVGFQTPHFSTTTDGYETKKHTTFQLFQASSSEASNFLFLNTQPFFAHGQHKIVSSGTDGYRYIRFT